MNPAVIALGEGMIGTMAVAIPLAFFVLALYVFYAVISRSADPFHLLMIALSIAFLVAPVAMAAGGVDMIWCLLVLSLTPWVTVIGYETVGYRHNAEVLEALRD